ncbi:unnamed protein product [Cyberlindnera jadinii]|uniref:Mtf2-like C-terminal domain-containing protein n=2 Tax=Cyberlindnera jadinii (strain ATCC 18201 / CBS 1600 / BCRC 20928 / JCM 3617 / NBRC 0987 / NRRL Y-1542) TaxID=983966 RepID=A0A0H5CIT8_CYBJN|nr:unnamed protein product [Cyberlindnera jadinii]
MLNTNISTRVLRLKGRGIRLSSFNASKKDNVMSSKEDEENFTNIFNKIMDRSKHSKEKTDGLLFEKTFASMDRLKHSEVQPKLVRTGELSANVFLKKSLMTQREDGERLKKLSHSLNETLKAIDAMENDLEVYEFMEPLIKSMDSKINGQLKFNQELLSKVALQSNGEPLSPLCNEFTMPYLLIKCISILKDKFRSPDVAISLFELSKEQSLKTFIFLCVIGVYNQMLQLYWDSFKSIAKVNSLITEMKVNGIQGNHETTRVLRSISKECHTMLNYDDDKFFFTLENGVEAWAPMWNKNDEQELKSVDDYIADLYVYLEQVYSQ